MQDRPARVPSFRLLLVSMLVAGLTTGCGALLRLGTNDDLPIQFANGELRSREAHSLEALDGACERAIATLGYDDETAAREEGRVLWSARTAGGDGVEIDLIAKAPDRSELRIRFGVLGDETRARLLLEQIHQSL